MNQSQALDDTSAALALIDPWLRAHLPALDAAVTRRFVQLVTVIFEQRSLLLETSAESTAFAGTDSSNATQVRRIIRDARISLNDVFYPLLQELIAELPNEVLYLTMDETSHHTDYCVVQVGLTTDGVSLPLGFHIYAPDAAWADDARELLEAIDAILPHRCRIVLTHQDAGRPRHGAHHAIERIVRPASGAPRVFALAAPHLTRLELLVHEVLPAAAKEASG